MGEFTKIAWCRSTFNSWTGCTKVSPGCANCYAEGLARRYGWDVWGPGKPRRRTSPANWRQPLKWQRQAAQTGEFWPVFCGSLMDWCDPEAPAGALADLWPVIRDTPALTWLLLTKRPGRLAECLPSDWGQHDYTHVWLGVSVENQAAADERIPFLLQTPAAVRFVSCEPLLGSVLLDNGESSWLTCNGQNQTGDPTQHYCCGSYASTGQHFHGVDWVIVGGESGPKARPMHPDWARSLRDQCQAAGVAYYFKQWGEWLVSSHCDPTAMKANITTTITASAADTFPVTLFRVGAKAAGDLLDGRQHHEFPAARAAQYQHLLAMLDGGEE
jgi:protein gp37